MNARSPCQLRDALDALLHFLGPGQHQVRQLVYDHHDPWQRLEVFLRMGFQVGIVGRYVAHTAQPEEVIAVIHHFHNHFQGLVGQFRVCDHRCQQMRHLCIRGKFHLFRIHQDQLDIIGPCPHQQAADDGIHADGLAGSRGAGYQQMGHAVQPPKDVVSLQVLSQREQQFLTLEIFRNSRHKFLHLHGCLLRVGNLDAHGRLAGNRGFNADVCGAQRHLDVILEIGDPGNPHPHIRPDFEPCDGRTNVDGRQRGLHIEFPKNADQLFSLFPCVGPVCTALSAPRNRIQKGKFRDRVPCIPCCPIRQLRRGCSLFLSPCHGPDWTQFLLLSFFISRFWGTHRFPDTGNFRFLPARTDLFLPG